MPAGVQVGERNVELRSGVQRQPRLDNASANGPRRRRYCKGQAAWLPNGCFSNQHQTRTWCRGELGQPSVVLQPGAESQ